MFGRSWKVAGNKEWAEAYASFLTACLNNGVRAESPVGIKESANFVVTHVTACSKSLLMSLIGEEDRVPRRWTNDGGNYGLSRRFNFLPSTNETGLVRAFRELDENGLVLGIGNPDSLSKVPSDFHKFVVNTFVSSTTIPKKFPDFLRDPNLWVFGGILSSDLAAELRIRSGFSYTEPDGIATYNAYVSLSEGKTTLRDVSAAISGDITFDSVNVSLDPRIEVRRLTEIVRDQGSRFRFKKMQVVHDFHTFDVVQMNARDDYHNNYLYTISSPSAEADTNPCNYYPEYKNRAFESLTTVVDWLAANTNTTKKAEEKVA